MKKAQIISLVCIFLLAVVCGCTVTKPDRGTGTFPPVVSTDEPDGTEPGTETEPKETAKETKPETAPGTETQPVTDPVTEPVTDPVTEPVTEPPETKPLDPAYDVLKTPAPWYQTPTATPKPSSEDPALCRVIRREAGNENRVFHDFYEAGIPATVVYEKNDTIPYGQVISVDLEGKTEDGYYFVKIGTSVTLHVSIAHGNEKMTDYNDRVMYLTFDDGPNKNTTEILSILGSYNIKVTFFEVGYCVKARPKDSKACFAQGHALGCHSYSHEFEDIYKSADALMAEVEKWEDTLASIHGGLPSYRLFRFCGGSTSTYLKNSVRDEIKERLTLDGYHYYDWTCATNDAYPQGRKAGQSVEDYFTTSLKTSVKSAKNSGRPAVCLMHETNKDTVELLPWCIEYMLDQGYTFRTLDLLPENVLFH